METGGNVGCRTSQDGRVNDRCVERALRAVSPDVTRTGYISDGARGFPSGTNVIQFYYPDPVTHNGYMLDLALLPNGKTHYVHEWGKLGTDIRVDEQAQVLPLLVRANSEVARLCGLSFAGSTPRVGPG